MGIVWRGATWLCHQKSAAKHSVLQRLKESLCHHFGTACYILCALGLQMKTIRRWADPYPPDWWLYWQWHSAAWWGSWVRHHWRPGSQSCNACELAGSWRLRVSRRGPGGAVQPPRCRRSAHKHHAHTSYTPRYTRGQSGHLSPVARPTLVTPRSRLCWKLRWEGLKEQLRTETDRNT